MQPPCRFMVHPEAWTAGAGWRLNVMICVRQSGGLHPPDTGNCRNVDIGIARLGFFLLLRRGGAQLQPRACAAAARAGHPGAAGRCGPGAQPGAGSGCRRRAHHAGAGLALRRLCRCGFRRADGRGLPPALRRSDAARRRELRGGRCTRAALRAGQLRSGAVQLQRARSGRRRRAAATWPTAKSARSTRTQAS